MAKFASLPLFTDAYLADTAHLSDAEHGRYLLLLMTMWRVPGCRLPNDDQWLARHFRRSVEQVQAELRPIISEFMQSDGNWITQKRLCKEFRFVTIAHEVRSDAAKLRWNKEKALHNAYAPSPSPSPSLKERNIKERKPRKIATEFPTNWQLSDDERQCAIALHWPADRIDREFKRFHDRALAKGATYRDWPAAWRNWVTSPFQAASPVLGDGSPTPDQIKRNQERMQREADEYRRKTYGEEKRDDAVRHATDGSGTQSPDQNDDALFPTCKTLQ